MADLRRRVYEAADAAAVADLMNLLEVHAGGHPGYTADDMRTTVSTLVRDVAADTSLLATPDGTLVAGAIVLSPPDGGYRIELQGGVHPQWRGNGLGRELLGWQLARAAQMHAASGAPAGWQAHVGALADDEDSLRLFRRFDLTPARYWFEMVASTGHPSVVEMPAGLRAVPYSAEHADVLYAAHVTAFEDHWGYQRRSMPEWTALTVASEGFRPELSAIAFAGAEVASYVLSYEDADPSRLYIGQVGTRRQWRRRGLAGALLARVIAAAKSAGMTSVALGVDANSPTGAVGVYERVGFEVESRSVSYWKPLGAEEADPARHNELSAR